LYIDNRQSQEDTESTAFGRKRWKYRRKEHREKSICEKEVETEKNRKTQKDIERHREKRMWEKEIETDK